MSQRPQTLDQWSRFCEIHSREEGETLTDWFARLERIANARTSEPEPTRLPYRDDARMPGEEG